MLYGICFYIEFRYVTVLQLVPALALGAIRCILDTGYMTVSTTVNGNNRNGCRQCDRRTTNACDVLTKEFEYIVITFASANNISCTFCTHFYSIFMEICSSLIIFVIILYLPESSASSRVGRHTFY
jgi:hypothetical protein